MNQETFESLWKALLVYAPDCPLPLVREFVNTSYSRVLAAGAWSALRGDGEFQIPDPVTIAGASVTKNDAVILTASAAAAHIGRQLYVDHAPFYTVIAATPGVSLTLDRPYVGETSASTQVIVELVYVTVPSDFLHFLSVTDNQENWRLHTGILSETLDLWDEQRTSTGSSWVVASTTPVPLTIAATGGFPRYEFWPRPSAAKAFSFKYIKKPALLSAAGDKLVFPIRGDAVKHGAMAELSLWPGTAERKNPYFSLDLARTFEEKFQLDLISTQREDQEIVQTMVQYSDEDIPLAPLDGEFIQSHI